MENITIGQIAVALSFFVGVIGSVKYLFNELKTAVKKEIKDEISPLKTEINQVRNDARINRINSLKTDLVNLMSLAEDGSITKEQKINAHELYDEYSSNGGNSYIHDWWEKLVKEGKIWYWITSSIQF